MSSSKGKWHGIHVDDDGDTDVYHPQSCPWSVTFHPQVIDTSGNVISPSMTVRDHECDIAHELRENGNDINLFPRAPGFHWVRLEHITIPGGPWGPTEYDIASEWHEVERPRLISEDAP